MELQKITASFICDLVNHLWNIFKRWNQMGRREHFWHSCSETSAANRKEASSSSHKKYASLTSSKWLFLNLELNARSYNTSQLKYLDCLLKVVCYLLRKKNRSERSNAARCGGNGWLRPTAGPGPVKKRTDREETAVEQAYTPYRFSEGMFAQIAYLNPTTRAAGVQMWSNKKKGQRFTSAPDMCRQFSRDRRASLACIADPFIKRRGQNVTFLPNNDS